MAFRRCRVLFLWGPSLAPRAVDHICWTALVQAVDYLQRLLRLDGTDAEIWARLGYSFLMMQDGTRCALCRAHVAVVRMCLYLMLFCVACGRATSTVQGRCS